jgi:hypothetical protein
MTLAEFREKYGERVLTLVATEIVKAGLDVVKEEGITGRPMEVTIAAVAEDLIKADWNDVRAVIKRNL